MSAVDSCFFPQMVGQKRKGISIAKARPKSPIMVRSNCVAKSSILIIQLPHIQNLELNTTLSMGQGEPRSVHVVTNGYAVMLLQLDVIYGSVFIVVTSIRTHQKGSEVTQ